MAGAFQSGFQMGQAGYQQAIDNLDREERRKQEAEERALRMAHMQEGLDATRRQTVREKEIDALTQQLTSPNAGNYTLGGPAYSGLRMPQQVDAEGQIPVTRLTASSGMDDGRLRMPAASVGAAPASGLRASISSAAPATFNQAPTRGAAEDILGRIALLKGDSGGFRQSQINRRTMEDEDLFTNKFKEYNGSPEQIASTAAYLNQNSRRLTMGRPDKNGLVSLSVVKGDGTAEFLNLSKPEQARLYAAGHLLESNPFKALEMIANVNKDLAAAVAADNGLQVNLAGNTNDVASKSATISHQERQDKNDAARTNALSKHYDALTERYKKELEASNWGTEQYIDKDGNLRVFDVNRKGRVPDFRERTLPGGMRPYNPKPAPEVMTMKDFVETFGEQYIAQDGGKKVKLRDLPPARVREEYGQFIRSSVPSGLPDVDAPPRNPAASSGARSGLPAAPPAGDYGLFEQMSDADLARYVRAGNAIAVEVDRRRRSEPVPTRFGMGQFDYSE